MDMKLHICVRRKWGDDSSLEVEDGELALVPMVEERIERRTIRHGSQFSDTMKTNGQWLIIKVFSHRFI